MSPVHLLESSSRSNLREKFFVNYTTVEYYISRRYPLEGSMFAILSITICSTLMGRRCGAAQIVARRQFRRACAVRSARG
eukprot:6179403-Pleurochrysis_carterae.AAC.7